MTVSLLPSLTDEQAMLVDASVRFMEAEVPIAAVRRRSDGADGDDPGYRRTAAELGWFGLLAGEAQGGGSASGNGLLDAALIAAERGARLQPGPFADHSVVVHALATNGSAAHAAVLEELVLGARWAAWADGSNRTCALRSTAGGLRLDGTIGVVADCGDDGRLLLTAAGPEGPTQVVLRVDEQGVVVTRLDSLDVTRRSCRITFEEVPVAPDAIVGAPGAATEKVVRHQAQIAAVLTAADAVGAMHADFHVALQYAKDRIAFGRPIGSFQAIKHLLADTSLWLEMSKALVASAATALGSGAADGGELAHAAKAFVAEGGTDLAQSCFQVFGGIGYTWEHDQHLYLRRIAADAASFGSAAWHRTQLLDVVGVDR